MKALSVAVILLLTAPAVMAQQSLPTETATHIFWQPDRKLTAEDFQGDGSAAPDNIEEFNLSTVAFLGTWSTVDIPNKKLSRKGVLEEKVYFVPAFEKGTSYMLNDADSIGIKYEQLLFDIDELVARKSRRELQAYQDELGGSTGIKTIMYMTVKTENDNFRKEFTNSVVHDVHLGNTPNAYNDWRAFVDKYLDELKEYATTPEDCYRFVVGAPIVDNYEQAKYLRGPIEKGDTLIIGTMDPKKYGRKVRK